MKRRLTLLALLFLLPAAWANDTLTANCEADLALKEARADLRQNFIREYAEMIFAGEEQNQIWIDDALNPPSSSDLHVLIENSWIKKLNDKVFKNKDLVTALTNFHKQLFLEELTARNIPLKMDPYQDFKSTRLTLPDGGELNLVERAFQASKVRFYSSPILKEILREEDMQESWFRMGAGRSETQAALAARYARDHSGGRDVSYFWDSEVLSGLNDKLQQVKALHRQILSALGGSSLLERDRQGTHLKLEVFATARKSGPKDFLQTLLQLFPDAKLNARKAALILRYTQLSDEFSPSVLVAKRELLTIHDAPFGAMAIDFIGLGAENLRATTKALVLGRDLDHAVNLTRAFERKVTQMFNSRKEQVEKTIHQHFQGQVKMRFSGDDGVIIPQRELSIRDQLMLIHDLSKLMPRPFFRMAVISAEGAAHADSSQLITHGESIEKTLRQLILRDLGNRRSNEISLQMFIPDTGAIRKVFLFMNAKTRFNKEETRIMHNAFSSAVKMVQNQVQAQGHAIEYDGIEIFVIYKKGGKK